jgi:hypothetical protein
MDIATEYIFMAWILNWVSNSFVQDCRYHCGHCLVASEFYSGKLIFVSNLPEGKWSLHLAKSSSETSSHPLCVHAIPDSPPGKYVCHRVSSLESSQWLRELYGEQKGEQKCFVQVETCLSASKITFYFFKPFQHSSQSTTIFLINLSWTSYSSVESSHLRQKSTSRVRVESFGAVHSRRDIFRVQLAL